MRRAWWLVCVAGSAACTDPDAEIIAAPVYWMEWPAQVLAATPFTVRLVGTGAECRTVLRFDTSPTVDQSAVTFEPYFVVSTAPAPCPLPRQADPATGMIPIPWSFDTRAQVPPLTPPQPRTYEMRAGVDWILWNQQVPRLPVWTFGQIEVRSDTAGTDRLGAGGYVNAARDPQTGCLRLNFIGLGSGYVVENPPDTASYWSAAVQGYLHTVPAPLCGETRVFHLDARRF